MCVGDNTSVAMRCGCYAYHSRLAVRGVAWPEFVALAAALFVVLPMALLMALPTALPKSRVGDMRGDALADKVYTLLRNRESCACASRKL